MMTLTKYGIREWGGGAAIALVLLACAFTLIRRGFPAAGWTLAAVTLLVYCGLAAFFRNPCRQITAAPGELVSPADGVVRDIGEVEFDQAPFSGRALRVGIFLSVFDVHVNRAPAELEVVSVLYREGRYLDARHVNCAKENEAMTIAGHAVAGDGFRFPLAVRQISGAIARRIVCPVEPGRKLAKGEIYGMIKFGSRTEIYLPVEGFKLNVKPGDRVYAGLSIVATLEK